jgi:hypothetical protein
VKIGGTIIIMWCIEPLLGIDLEANEYNRCYAVKGKVFPSTGLGGP